MPEVNIIGNLLGASDFPSSVFCVWELVCSNDNWSVLAGDLKGQTHVVESKEDEYAVWEHPFDVHLSTSSVSGWPVLKVNVWQRAALGYVEMVGYGCVRVPTSPGSHTLDIVTWVPEGTKMERLSAWLIGGNPQLKHPAVVEEPNMDKHELQTTASGTVHVELSVLVRGFQEKGVQLHT